MEVLLLWMGRLAGLGGLALSAWAAYGRLSGRYFIGGFQIGTILQAGTTAIVFGCFCLLLALTVRPRR